MKIRPVGALLFLADVHTNGQTYLHTQGQTDGWADSHTK